MKLVYCSKCNTQLLVTRKAYAKYAKILDIVDPHICPEEPLPLDLGAPSDLPPIQPKSVQKLDELRPSITTEDLRDRRVDVKDTDSSAPLNLLDQIRKMKGNG